MRLPRGGKTFWEKAPCGGAKYEDVEGRRKDTDKRKRGVGGELVEPEVEVRVGPEREKREPEANQRRR